jgi:membrane fusion protein
VQSQRTQLIQQMAEADSSQGYSLTSPIAGTVTAVTARLGQPAAQGQPLMVVVPAGGRTRVELYVPTSAAGFLKTGQEVRLAVDAFPYQQFGTLPARISDISTTAVAKQSSEGAVPVYLVTAELLRPTVRAFGREQRLLPGMTLSARIVTRKQSLFEWLFEPLFAVGRR